VVRRIRTARELGATIRDRRGQLGWSQGELAVAAGVSRQWLSELESGKQTAEVGLVLRVFDALDLDLVPQSRQAEGPERRVGADTVAAVDLDDVLNDYRHR
jgi:HTH-type transcriptional regulator / antitoxin HipB